MNQLVHETSPYLLQHSHNPVNWYPWNDEALRRARQFDKPIFLSIGYSACHWCHVMERESFENEDIASLLNEHFISIKVDREERPDIDEVYMNAVQLMTGSGGWPLSVWLTPDLEPFFGGTYFPPEDRWGRVGFRNILTRIVQAWKDGRAGLSETTSRIMLRLKGLTDLQGSRTALDFSLWDHAYRDASSQFDHRHGGFGSAPKFPQALVLSFLLRYYFHSGETNALQMVEQTLTAMGRGGMFDQLGGGFHRYSTDERWLLPHFEKMLYDNAMLSSVYLEAFQLTGNTFYAEIATSILNYVLREMTSPEGGFYSSQDADSEGVEGKYYIWQQRDIEQILGKDESGLFCDYYGISGDGENILHCRRDDQGVAKQYQLSVQELKGRLEEAKKRLREVRSNRKAPMTDDKILTDWNGLMISAFCKGYQILGIEKYLIAAQKAFDFLYENQYIQNRVLRTHRAGEGYLSDYAFLVAALIDLYESSFNFSYVHLARHLNELTIRKFWDRGFFYVAANSNELPVRPRNSYDHAIPAGHSVAVHNLLRMGALTGDHRLKEQAAEAAQMYGDLMMRSPASFAHLLSALDYFWGRPKEIVIAGERDTDDVRDMVAAVYRHYLPNKIIAYADSALNDADARSLPVIQGKASDSREARIFLCENFTCQRPFQRPAEYSDYYRSASENRNYQKIR